MDRLQLYCLTPLPGSADPKGMHERSKYMDPDLNNDELNHVATRHPRMSTEEWHGIYCEA